MLAHFRDLHHFFSESSAKKTQIEGTFINLFVVNSPK